MAMIRVIRKIKVIKLVKSNGPKVPDTLCILIILQHKHIIISQVASIAASAGRVGGNAGTCVKGIESFARFDRIPDQRNWTQWLPDNTVSRSSSFSLL